MKPLPAKVAIEVDVAVGDGGAVGCGVAAGLLVAVLQATSSAARTRLQKARGVQPERCVNRLSMGNFILSFIRAPLAIADGKHREHYY